MIHVQEIETYLTDLTATQSALQEVYREKASAIRQARFDVFEQLNAREQELSLALLELQQRRIALLADHASNEPIPNSLAELLETSHHPASAELLNWIGQVQQQTHALHQQNWMQNYLVRRWMQHYEELTGILSRRGRERTSYGPASRQQSTGGALLDTSI